MPNHLRAETDAAAVAELALELDGVLPIATVDRLNHHAVSIHERYRQEINPPLPSPVRKHRQVEVADTNSLRRYIEFWGFHSEAPTFEIMAGLENQTIVAVLDTVEPAYPSPPDVLIPEHVNGYGCHQARLELRFDHRFKEWLDKDRQVMSQKELAAFLDERYVDTVVPEEERHGLADGSAIAPLDLRQLSKNFRVTQTMAVRSVIETRSGAVDFAFVQTEEKSDTAIRYPDNIWIHLPVYDSSVVEVTLRLKMAYRLAGEEGKKAPVFWYQIVDRTMMLEQAFREEASLLMTGARMSGMESRMFFVRNADFLPVVGDAKK